MRGEAFGLHGHGVPLVREIGCSSTFGTMINMRGEERDASTAVRLPPRSGRATSPSFPHPALNGAVSEIWSEIGSGFELANVVQDGGKRIEPGADAGLSDE